MMLIRLTRATDGRIAAPIKPRGQRCEFHRRILETQAAIPAQVQTNLHSIRMKTCAPIKLLRRLKIVPRKAGARLQAAMQMLPARADRMPDSAFTETSFFPFPSGNRTGCIELD